jgi:Zn-dependent M28 family amino/carboxypeptidase
MKVLWCLPIFLSLLTCSCKEENTWFGWNSSCEPEGVVEAVSGDQLYTTLLALTSIPTRWDWDGQQAALHVITNRLAELGIGYAVHTYVSSGKTYTNIEITIPGMEAASEIYAVGAHYDAMPGVPGADDNASGSAAVVELARLLHACQYKRTIKILLFSNEEIGRIGSKNYASKAAIRGDNILGFLNIDMIGWKPADGSLEVVAHNAYETFVQDVVSAARLYGKSQVNAVIANTCGCGDEGSFWEKGYTAALVIDDYSVIAGAPTNPYNHTVNDTLSTLDLTYHTNAVGAIAAAITVLADR